MTTSLNNSSRNVDSPSTKSQRIKFSDTQMTKKQLLRDIQHLKSKIEKSETNLNAMFKDIEPAIELQDSENWHFSRTQNIETKLRDDLYKFAGFRGVCLKKGEIIFNFTSAKDKQKENTQAIQIFIKDGNGHIGKWVMPMIVDINNMLTNTNIAKLQDIPPFIKSCKHHINCYTLRQEQFLSLKASISDLKHCSLQSNIEYTQVNLELYGVHNTKDDIYVNLVIYLSYYSNQVIPYDIEVDTTDKRKLSEDERERLKVSLKPFKKFDLQTAFEKVLIEDESAFAWTRVEDSEITLESNDTSVSDEESLSAHLQSRLRRLSQKIKSKRELQKKRNEKLKRRKTKIKTASINKPSGSKTSDIEQNIESALESNNTSVSDEESLSAHLQSKRRRSSQKIKSKRELQKKRNEKLKRRKTKTKTASINKPSGSKTSDIEQNIGSTLESNNTSVSDEESLSAHLQSRLRRLSQKIKSKRELQVKRNEKLKRRKTKTKTASMNKPSGSETSVIEQNNSKTVFESTPVKKSKTAGKQTKLNFQTIHATKSNLNANKNSLFESRSYNKKSKRAKLLTSTPLRSNAKHNPLSLLHLELNNITDIESVGSN